MISIPQFIVESSFCLLIFYGFYYGVLAKETFFQLNRFYLLVTPLLSILIPILNIQLSQPAGEATTGVSTILYPILEEGKAWEQAIWRAPESSKIRLKDLAFWIYWMGVTITSFYLLAGLFKLFRIIRRNNIELQDNYKVVTGSKFPASSFFSYVFWNKKEMSREQTLVWEHELVHVKQWHSLDVLLMEVWVIIKWFNPLIYLFRRSLRVTHEYIADKYVSSQLQSKYEYALYLTKVQEQAVNSPYLNQFAQLLKKRLLMLARKPSRNWKTSKYFLSVPLVTTLMLLFSFDLVDELPKPISQTFKKAESIINTIGERELPIATLTNEEPGESVPFSVPFLRATYPSLESMSPQDNEVDFSRLLSNPEEKDFNSIFNSFLATIPESYFPVDTSTFTMQWQGKTCDCNPGQLPNYYSCKSQSFGLKTFKRIVREGGFRLFKDGREVAYDELEVTSKRAFKMKGKLNQYENQNSFNPKSKFWKELKAGDVLKFTLRSGINDYFQFNVTINNKKESIDYAYDFYLGDLWVPINMTNNIGIKYVDDELFAQLLAQKDGQVKLIKNEEESVDIKYLEVRFNRVMGNQFENPNQKITVGQIKALNNAERGDRINFWINNGPNVEGKKVQVSIIRKGKKSDTYKSKHKLSWGHLIAQPFNREFILSKEEAQALSGQKIIFEYNGQKVPIKSIKEVWHMSKQPLPPGSSSPFQVEKSICSIPDFQADQTCIDKLLTNLKKGDIIRVESVSTNDGHLFNFLIRIGSESELHDARYFAPLSAFPIFMSSRIIGVSDPYQKIGQKGIDHIFNYKTLAGATPRVEIDFESYKGTAAIEALQALNPNQIRSITLFLRQDGGLGQVNNLALDPQDAPRIVISLKDAGSVIQQINPKDALADENTLRKLEDLGKEFLIIIDGEEKGSYKGRKLVEVLKGISKEEVEDLRVLKAEAAKEQFGVQRGVGAIIIKTKK